MAFDWQSELSASTVPSLSMQIIPAVSPPKVVSFAQVVKAPHVTSVEPFPTLPFVEILCQLRLHIRHMSED